MTAPQTPLFMSITHSIITVPGWRNSGAGYLQSQWAAQRPDAVWVAQDDWVTPARTAWVHALSSAIQAHSHPAVVAHSLGCIVATHLPADPERRAIRSDFSLVPGQRLPYRHVLLGHDNHVH